MTAKRELKEELGIDVENPEHTKRAKMQYIKIPNQEINSVGFIMKVDLNLNAQELKEHYQDFKKKLQENGEIIEFEEIFAIPKEKEKIEEFFKQHNGNHYQYLKELVEKDERNKEKEVDKEEER